MNTGEGKGKGRHLDLLTAILRKVVPGNTTAWVGLQDTEEVRPLQAMEDDLRQGRHLHPEDMEDNLPGLHQHLGDIEDSLLGLHQHLEDTEDSLQGLHRYPGATEEGLYPEDMGEGHHHLNRRFPEAMAEALCQVQTMRMRDKKPSQANNQYNCTEMDPHRHCRSSILVRVK